MVEKWKSYKLVCFIIACILLDFAGERFASFLELPVRLNALGTIVAACILGPVCGAIIGCTMCFMEAAFFPLSGVYALSQGVIAVVFGIFAKRGWLKKPFLGFSTAIIATVFNTVISVFLNYFCYQGMTNHVWGDGVIRYMQETLNKNVLCWISGEFCLNLTDMILASSLLYIGIKGYEWKHRKTSAELLGGVFVVLMAVMLPFQSVKAEKKSALPLDDYTQTIYNNANGIPGGTVNSIAQTRDGMIWVGTYSGLYQYDGKNFQFMSNFQNVRNVNCLYTDEEGRLLIGTNDSGLAICANNEIVNVIDTTNGLPADSVRSAVKSADGLYYVGTSNELCTIALADGMKVAKVVENLKYVTGLAASKDGYVCAVTGKGQLALLKNGEILDMREESEFGGSYTGVYWGETGEIYVALTNNVIQKLWIQQNQLCEGEIITCKGLNNINSISGDESGRMFVCAENGIGYWVQGSTVRIVPTEDFNSSIENMLVDYQGNCWFSSSRLGLLKLSKSNFEEVYTKVGLENKVVNAITKWDGRYYFGTDAGLDVVNEYMERTVSDHIATILGSVRVRALTVDKRGKLWIATAGQGVYEISINRSYKQYTVGNGLAGDKARTFWELADGAMVVATDNGISVIKDSTVIKNYKAEDGMSNEKTLCIYEADGCLYAGTDGGGVNVIQDGKVQRVIDKSAGLSSAVILRLKEAGDGSGMYIVTGNGLNFMTWDGNIRQLNQFPFFNNFDIISDQNGSLWVTSSAGIYIVKEQELLYGDTLDYLLLDVKKGFRNMLTANSWNYVDKNGNLFLCCDSGVVSIDMDKYDKQKNSYRMFLESVTIDGVTTYVDKEDINYIKRDAVRVEFIPKVINFAEEDPYVSVWLEGFENQPTVVLQSELETLSYTNLPFGEYIFHLAILDNKQEKVLEQISYSFVKEKEIFDNWWFKLYLLLLATMVVIYLVWLIIGTQIEKNLKIQKKEFENLKLKQQADAAVAAGEAKDKFLALMSHDIRTPINAILGMNEMILRSSKEEVVCDYAKDIKSSGNMLLALVNMILDFSKIEGGKMEIVPAEYNTKELVHDLTSGIAASAVQKGLDFKIEVEESIPSRLYGDDVRINQVVSNLLSNAVKYTEKGFFSLIIREHKREADKIVLSVEVRDSGIGIKEEELPLLCESFKRLDEKRNRKIEGTGLGMSIVTSLLALMGSKLTVESKYGVGSTFSFLLEQTIVDEKPIGKLDTLHVIEQEKKERLYAPGAKVLVVDDNEMNVKVACSLLSTNGIAADAAASGEEAIAYVKEKQYHVILLDHMMPGMDGIETLNMIRENKLVTDKTRIIILTANAVKGAKEQYLKAGFDDYLSKPIDNRLLEDMLKKYLPEECLQPSKEEEPKTESVVGENLSEEDTQTRQVKEKCPEIDLEVGLKYCIDSMEFYRDVVVEYVKGSKEQQLEEFFTQKDWHNYLVLIHSLKSVSLSIGAVSVSEHAKELEHACKEENISYVEKEHANFMIEYRVLLSHLKEYLGE